MPNHYTGYLSIIDTSSHWLSGPDNSFALFFIQQSNQLQVQKVQLKTHNECRLFAANSNFFLISLNMNQATGHLHNRDRQFHESLPSGRLANSRCTSAKELQLHFWLHCETQSKHITDCGSIFSWYPRQGFGRRIELHDWAVTSRCHISRFLRTRRANYN